MAKRSRLLPLLAVVWLLPAMTWAGPLSRHWRVTELWPNKPVVGGVWYRTGSPLDRGLNVGTGYVALYVIEVVPGAQYTLQLKAPHSLQRIRAYVVDRWPGDTGARRMALPTGPAMIAPHARHVTYRWRIGVAARSPGNLLYLLVRYPRDPGRRLELAPKIIVFSPPISPMHDIGHGVTYLQGPGELMLSDDAMTAPAMLPAEMSGHFDDAQPGWPSSGDLVSNGRFAAGLKNWTPIHVGQQGAREPTVDSEGLRLLPDTGVSQQLDADVAHDDALVLRAYLRVERASGARDGHPGLTITVCYQDGLGRRHCGDNAYRSLFYVADMPEKASGASRSQEKMVPNGRWYRFKVNLMDVTPKPIHIESISLLGPAHAGRAQVREVHLLPEEDDATH